MVLDGSTGWRGSVLINRFTVIGGEGTGGTASGEYEKDSSLSIKVQLFDSKIAVMVDIFSDDEYC